MKITESQLKQIVEYAQNEHIQKIMKVLREAFDQNKKLRIIKNGK